MRFLALALIVLFYQNHSVAMVEKDLMSESVQLKQCAISNQACFDQIEPHFNHYKSLGRPEAFIYYSQKNYSQKSALLIHSYTMSPDEMTDIGKVLQSKGYNVIGIQLEAHHQRSKFVDMKNVSAADWNNDFRYGLNIAQALGKEVLVVGYSLGGLIAINGAMKYQSEIHAVAGLAPALALRRGAETFSCLGRSLSDTTFLNSLSVKFVGQSIGDYEKIYINGACAIKGLINDLFPPVQNIGFDETKTHQRWEEPMRERLSQIKIPVYVSLTEADEILDPSTIDYIIKDMPQLSSTLYPEISNLSHLYMAKALITYKRLNYVIVPDFNTDFSSFIRSID